MRSSPRGTLFFALAALVGACTDQRHPVAPSFSLSGAATCPTPANVVVHDEAGLLAALRTAYPGEVIGLDAFFPVNADVAIRAEHVTLTCATPGAGIFAAPGAGVLEMLTVGANGVVVDRLVLDASAAIDGDVFLVDGFAGVQVTNNTITCAVGTLGSCGFFLGATAAVIADNHFQSAGSLSGVHMQAGSDGGGIDGSRVERNTIVATAPSTGFGFGGIRVRDGNNVVVAGNVVLGPWSSSIATVSLAGSRFENNRLAGAMVNGIRFNQGPLRTSDNVFKGNVVTGAGSAGIFAQSACRNVFLGNDLQGNAGNVGLIFRVNSGGNTFVGNGTIVVDDGAFDCDGDGVNEPNMITGAGAVMHGVNLGEVVSDVVRTKHGIIVQ
jgi:parallel beta helix pectate lyase-like protein